jgi:hypothetical protein
MKLGLNILGSLFLLIGLVWALQGSNVFPGSFMSGQTLWLYIGAIIATFGLFLLVWNNLGKT